MKTTTKNLLVVILLEDNGTEIIIDLAMTETIDMDGNMVNVNVALVDMPIK